MYIFDERVGRRKFLKIGGASLAAAGTAMVSGCEKLRHAGHELPVNEGGIKKWGIEAGEWIPTCCNMCGGQSGIFVQVVDGVVQRIEPNHWNPNNYSNISSDFFDGYSEEYGCKEGGAICAKGSAGIMQLYDPDRVKKPLKRTNKDKTPGADPGWKEISWSQAQKEIAARLGALRDQGEAHKLLWISEDHSFTHIQKDFCKLFGTPNYGMHSNLCDVARKAAFKTAMGYDRPLADFIQSKYILLFGWNPTSASKWIYLPRIITRAVERGARLVVVDPYMSDTAAKAHEWIGIRPATDGAMALAMASVIIRDKLFDEEFVNRWTTGFEKFAAHVKNKTPKWAEQITTVPAKTIERIAHELATTKPALIDVWSGPGQHSNGVQGGRAIVALNSLLGTWDAPGGMLIPEKKGNKHGHVDPESRAAVTLGKARFDELESYPLGHKSGVYCQLFDNLANNKGPYQPKMMMCVFQNPMMSVPGSQNVAKALAKLETLVVVDTMLSETAMLADYVLPGTTYFERYDLNTHWVSWPCLGLRQPVVKPIFGQPTEYEFVASLGRDLDLKTKEGVKLFEVGPLSKQAIADVQTWYEDYLSSEIKNGAAKITLSELKSLPGAVWVDKKGTHYRKYANALPAEKLKSAWFYGDKTRDGTLVFDKAKNLGGKLIGVVVDGNVVEGFKTKSKKAEFVSGWLKEKRDFQGGSINPLPDYEPRDWQPSKSYPLYLINWKEANHTHSRSQNNPWLLEIKPDNPLVINPSTAQEFGVLHGEKVLVNSPYGSVEAVIKVSKRMHEGVVGLQHGFGHRALGRLAKGRGTADAFLRLTKSDKISGQALHKETCVTIKKIV